MPPYVSQVVAIVEEAKARGYTPDDVMQAFDKSIGIGARMIRQGHHGFCVHQYSIECRIWHILFGHDDAKPFPGVNPLIEYHLKYQQLEEARQAYEDKDQELDHKLQLIKELSDEATVLHVASIEKQGRMYKWVERALAVRAVITGLRYGHLSGSNQHEKHSYLMQIWMAIRREEHRYLMQIWMAIRRIITRLDDDVAEMRREHQEKLNTLRKLKFEVVRLDVELIDKEAELERILTEWEEVRANFKSANKP